MLSIMKTGLYFTDSIVRARLLQGETLTSSDVPDEDLASEIDEGGGSVWYCGFCQVVHSPNRPGACDVDEMPPVGCTSEDDFFYDHGEDRGEYAQQAFSEYLADEKKRETAEGEHALYLEALELRLIERR